MECAARRRLVDRADEPDVSRGDALCVAVSDRVAKPPGQRLHRRAVAHVLEPLLGGRPHALLLLLDVRHFRSNARGPRARRWYQSLLSRLAPRMPLPILATWFMRAARAAPRRRG